MLYRELADENRKLKIKIEELTTKIQILKVENKTANLELSKMSSKVSQDHKILRDIDGVI